MTTHRFARFAAATLVVLALLLFGVTWFYSGEIREGALRSEPPSPPSYDVEVLSAVRDAVELERDPERPALVADGVWGVRGRDGYGHLERITRLSRDRVVRRYRHLTGARPRAGDQVAIESSAFPSDPRAAFGLSYDEIRYRSELGRTPAWRLRGRRPTWVIFVHGYNSSRREALRLLEPVNRAGFPALVISYRNDPGAPSTGSGRREWGVSEWRDVEGAVRYAVDRGASRVALVGYSMGGAVVASFLYESRLADVAVGAVLDAPALDLAEVVEHEAGRRRLPLLGTPIPPPLPALARTLTSWRFGVDWERIDYVERARELPVPALVLHGTSDETVPLSTSVAFARARPDLVTLLRFPGAGHVQAWNTDRARYERRVVAFLERVATRARSQPG